MSWRKDEALRRFFEATLVLREIHGQARLIDIYEQEIHREIVVRNHNATNQALLAATGAAQVSADRLDIAVKALEFYAEGDNHKARPNGLSAVAKDTGRRARHALEAIGSGDSGETENEETE